MHTIAPVPNINGSKASDLSDQMMKVYHALDKAAALMRMFQPHGRDYQIGGDYTADRQEFERRHRVIAELLDQYLLEAAATMDYHYNQGKAQLQQ
jgi:hypothetical protein